MSSSSTTTSKRPATVAELTAKAEIAVEEREKFAPTLWIRSAKTLLEQGMEAMQEDQGEGLNQAFVKLLRGIIIILEVVPKLKAHDPQHPLYTDIKKEIPVYLERVEALKPAINARYEEWKAKHPRKLKPEAMGSVADLKLSPPPVRLPFPPSIQPKVLSPMAKGKMDTVHGEKEDIQDSLVRRLEGLKLPSKSTHVAKKLTPPPPPQVSSKPINNESSLAISAKGIAQPFRPLPQPVLLAADGGSNITASSFLSVLQGGPRCSILICDVRTLEGFLHGHIKSFSGNPGSHTVHIEPDILLDSRTITSLDIEAGLSVFSLGNMSSYTYFCQRHTYDHVVMLDAASEQPSLYLQVLKKAIWESDFSKSLQRAPYFLIGGWSAITQEIARQGLQTSDYITIGVPSPSIDGGNMDLQPNLKLPRQTSSRSSAQFENPFYAFQRSTSVTTSNFMDSQFKAAFEMKYPEIAIPIFTESPILPVPPLIQSQQSSGVPSITLMTDSSGTHSTLPPPSYQQSTQQLPQPPIISQYTQLPPSYTQIQITPTEVVHSPRATALPIPSIVDDHHRIPVPEKPPTSSAATEAIAIPRRRSSSPSPTLVPNRHYEDPAALQPSQPPQLPPKPVSMIPAIPEVRVNKRLNAPVPPQLIRPRDSSVKLLSIASLGSSRIGLAGLKNLGNTCFMSSIIQCMSGTVPLSRYFLDGSYRKHMNRMNPMGSKGVMVQSYATLIQAIWSSQESIIVPSKFKDAIDSTMSIFKGNSQHDSQEFLGFLLDALHEDLNLARLPGVQQAKLPPLDEVSATMSEVQQIQHEWLRNRQLNWSIIMDMFQGLLKSRLKCVTCGKVSTSFSPFLYLSLPIPAVNSAGQKGGPVYLEECLNAFVMDEVLDGENAWLCPHCKKKRKATKRLQIARLPTILVVHLKRFYSHGHFQEKIDTYVEYAANGLNLTAYLPSSGQSEPYLYDLYAISNHYGNLSGGHYTAHVKNHGGAEWCCFDDARVTRVTEAGVKSKAAYILFYVRRGGGTPTLHNWWGSGTVG